MRTARCVHRNCFFSGQRWAKAGLAGYKILSPQDTGLIRIITLPSWSKLERKRPRGWRNQEARVMKNLSQFEELRRDQEALRYQFISTELDLAFTFVGISRSADDHERSERNLNHARRAVETAKKYLGETNLTASQRQELVEKLQKLEPLVPPDRQSSQAE